jgi:hypothetical protein
LSTSRKISKVVLVIFVLNQAELATDFLFIIDGYDCLKRAFDRVRMSVYIALISINIWRLCCLDIAARHFCGEVSRSTLTVYPYTSQYFEHQIQLFRREQMTIKLPQQLKIPVSILAGLGVGILIVSTSDSCVVRSTRAPQVADRPIDLPLVAPTIVNSESTAAVEVEDEQPIRLNSARIALKEARVAVSLSQAQLAQARINLIEFQAKHNKAKILSAQGKISRQHLDTAKAAYELAKLQHSSATIGLKESMTQLVAAKAEVYRIARKANPGATM